MYFWWVVLSFHHELKLAEKNTLYHELEECKSKSQFKIKYRATEVPVNLYNNWLCEIHPIQITIRHLIWCILILPSANHKESSLYKTIINSILVLKQLLYADRKKSPLSILVLFNHLQATCDHMRANWVCALEINTRYLRFCIIVEFNQL